MVVTDPRLPLVVEATGPRVRDVDEPLPRAFRPGRHYVGWVCREAKAEFGVLRKTQVNYDMVRRWVLRKLQSREMRPQHISRCIPNIVAYVFTQTEEEISGRQFMMTDLVRERDERMREVFTDSMGSLIPEPFDPEA